VSVHALCRQVTDAEEEAAQKADERAKVWKTHNGSNSNSTSPNTTPSTSVEIVPKDSQAGSANQTEQPASSSKAERSHSADGESLTLSCIQSFVWLITVLLSFIHPPPHSCAHSLTHSPAHSLTHSPTHTRSLTHSLAHSLMLVMLFEQCWSCEHS